MRTYTCPRMYFKDMEIDFLATFEKMWRSVSLHPLTNSWIRACFDHTDGEYEEAIKLLTQTSYGKTQRLIQARLHATFDLDPPSPTAKGLGKFRSLF